jgi:hypothetical protein
MGILFTKDLFEAKKYNVFFDKCALLGFRSSLDEENTFTDIANCNSGLQKQPALNLANADSAVQKPPQRRLAAK